MTHQLKLTPENHQVLYQQRWYAVGGLVIWLMVIVSLAYLLVRSVMRPQMEIGLTLIGLMIALVIFRNAPLRLHRIRLDLRQNEVAEVIGPATPEFRVMPGIIPIVRYWIHVQGLSFEVDKAQYFTIQHGATYCILYAPHAQILLSAQLQTTLPNPEPVLATILSQREHQVLRLIAQGLSNHEIAGELYLSINTVKMYTTQIYRKLEVSRRTEAIQRAHELNLL